MEQQVIQRLKQEKGTYLVEAYNEGYKIGQEDAQRLHYADLKSCAEGKIPQEVWSDLRDVIHQGIADDRWEPFSKEEVQEFKEGYLDAVQEFWEEVKEQL